MPARRTATATSSPSTCTARARWPRIAAPDNLLRIDDAVEIIFKCAKALHYAHSRGVIHRDVKPSNIMLTQDSDVRIIDFGIALVSDSDISRIEGIAGSPSYMSPEQVQSLELTNRSDLYSLGAVMYELLTGSRPFRAGNLQKLLHQIVYATPPPIHTLRNDVPEELENVVAIALQKEPAKRYKSGLDFAAELTRVHQKLREQNARIDRQEQFGVLRRLKFFHEFSHAEIWEVLRASTGRPIPLAEEIVKEGEMDDRFYIIVAGTCTVERHGIRLGAIETGECFGEASYVPGAKRTATIRARRAVTVLKVSSTLLEQVSASCQLRFNRVFLRTLISRLQSADSTTRRFRDWPAARAARPEVPLSCSMSAYAEWLWIDSKFSASTTYAAIRASAFSRAATSRTMSSTNFGFS